MSNGTKAYVITVDGRAYNVSIASADPNAMPVAAMPVAASFAAPAQAPVQTSAPTPAAPTAPVAGTDVTAPTPGLVLRTIVDEGEQVDQDQTILILEAMKMETEIKAPKAGKIVAMHVQSGDTVQTAAPLFAIA